MTRALFLALALGLVAASCSSPDPRIVYVEANCFDRGEWTDGYVPPRDLDVTPDDLGDVEPDGPQLAPWRPNSDSAIEDPNNHGRQPGFGV